MMRHTAVDMENSENLLGPSEDSLFYSRKKCVVTACLLILSYGLSYGLGVYTGYKANDCDGSSIFY